jgi:hypothetical protein
MIRYIRLIPILVLICTQTNISNAAGGSPFSCTDESGPISSMSLWLDASDTSSITMSGTRVTYWRDKSGNGRNATAVGDPSYQTGFGANKIIRLDGDDYFKLNLDFLANRSHSAFIVTKRENSANIYGAATGSVENRSLHVGYANDTRLRMNYWNNNCNATINTSQHTSGGNILNYVWPQGGNKQIYANGNLLSSTTCAAGTIGTMAGGGRIGNVVGQGMYQGEIAEIIMYTRVLSAAEREATEEYLAAKWGLTPGIINFNDYTLSSPYGVSQDSPSTGSVIVEDSGRRLWMSGNRWQVIDFDYTVTANTILEFTFKSSIQGEVQGVGFDNYNTTGPSGAGMFNVGGTQAWGIQDYQYQGGIKTFYIPVGDHFTGSFDRLVFSNDDDLNKVGSSKISNIRIYERP